MLGLIQLVEEREVHHGLQERIVACELGTLLPGSCIGRLRHPSLANGVEVGVLLVEFLHPLCHCIGVGIRIGVHTDAVDTHSLNPPHTVLDEVAHQVRVVLVQVRHRGHEPSLDGLLHIHFRGIGIHYGRELVRGLQIGTLSRL